MASPKPIPEHIIRQAHKEGKSAKQLSRELECSGPHILKWAKRYGISFSAFKDNANIAIFERIDHAEVAYILGYLWADGWVGDQHVSISLVADDAVHLRTILERHCKRLSIHHRHRKAEGFTRRPQTDIAICDSRFARLLLSFDYGNKSKVTPQKILAHIPQRLHPAFWLGYYDGDGHCKPNGHEISFTSTIEQDWTDMISLCKQLDIPYRIRRYIHPSRPHRFSAFIVRGYVAKCRLLDYLYTYGHLGLPRKAEKYHHILTKGQQRPNEQRRVEKWASRYTAPQSAV